MAELNENSLWVEKYRPKKLSELVLPDKERLEFQNMIDKQNIPNLLISGPAGGGKTTIARIICSKHGVLSNRKDNLLMVNGSRKSTRGIGFFDEVVDPYLKHPPVGDKYKIVFIDEADNLTPDGFLSLRGLIEKYQVTYGRFIFTCNFISKIPDPVQSRFTAYIFKQLPKEFIFNFCKDVLDKEKVSYQDETINIIISNLYPDFRRITNTLQRCSIDGKLQAKAEEITTLEKKILSSIVEIISFIEKGENSKIGQGVSHIIDILTENQNLEYRDIYSNLFLMKGIPAPAKIIINKYTNEHQGCLLPHQHFMAMCYDVIKSLIDYKTARSVK